MKINILRKIIKNKPEEISSSEEFFGGENCCIDVKVKMIYDGKKVMHSYVESEVYGTTQQGRQDEKLETAKRLIK